MLKPLPYPEKPKRLIENRRIFGGNDIEFSIYDTYQKANRVELVAQNPLYCGMITGRKVIHMDHRDSFDFLPNESLVVPSAEKIWIDFPDALMDQPTQCITIEIDQGKVEEIVGRLNEQFPRMPDSGEWTYDDEAPVRFENTQRFNQVLDQMIGCFTEQTPYRDVLIDLNSSQLIIHMLQSEARRLLLEETIPDGKGGVLEHVIQHIRTHIHTRITISELEKIACMSKATLFRHFKNELGFSPIEYINQLRMRRAAELLKEGKNVTEACFELGYKSLAHFIDMFKSVHGATPSQFKRSEM